MFNLKDEKSLELYVQDEDIIIRGRIDFLVFKHELWLAVVESKNAAISLREAIPQTLAYMLANPQPKRPTYSLLTNGDDFTFIKLTQQDTPQYALSDKFTFWKRENELYHVLRILKKLGKMILE